jgi:sugar phosphate isomerase/epimerase
MDTAFYNSLGSYDLDSKCELLRELGYDGVYLTLWSEPQWDDVPKLGTVFDRHGIEVAGVYVPADITADPDGPELSRIVELAQVLDGVTNVELAFLAPPEDRSEEMHSRALGLIERMVDHPGRTACKIVIYPHVGTWLGDFRQGLELCQRVAHPDVRLTFSAFHWYAADLGGYEELRRDLTDAVSLLESVSLAGSRRDPNVPGGQGATVEPLDTGELDNFALLGVLKDVGYRGRIGIQGYGDGGDAYEKLERSLRAVRSMERRLEEHPHWARLRPDRLPPPSRS